MAMEPSGSTRKKGEVPLVMQSEAAECGLACLAMLSRWYGHQIDIAYLRQKFGNVSRGMSMAGIAQCAESLKLTNSAYSTTAHDLGSWSGPPLLLHWKGNHFVILDRIDDGRFLINDPAIGRVSLTQAELEHGLSGAVLLVEPSDQFEPIKAKGIGNRLKLLPRTDELNKALFQLFVTSLGVEILSLLLPWQIKLVIDRSITVNDLSLLRHSAVVFSLTVALLFCLSILRNRFTNNLNVKVSNNWSLHFIGHVIRLPFWHIHGRSLGDLLSRLTSVGAIQFSLTTHVVDIGLGLVSIVVLAWLLIISSLELSIVVVLVVIALVVIRAIIYPVTLRLNEVCVAQDAMRHGEVADTLRGIQQIKVAGAYLRRMVRLTSKHSLIAKTELRLKNYMSFHASTVQVILSVQRVTLVAFGAVLVMESRLTVGALVAFMAYSEMFAWRTTNIIEKVAELKLLRVHVGRVSDLLSQEPDPLPSAAPTRISFDPPSIRTVELGYKFPHEKRWILRGLNIEVNAGEIVAIVGPSGVGKSTLANLLLGLLNPTEGRIEVNGIVLDSDLDLREQYKEMVSAVMQDDMLFAGSVLDNIVFEEESPDMARVVEVAAALGIHDAIQSMPMAYDTFVGEMGSALSGGQRQRLLVARALYKRPLFLILDEATSNLDLESEIIVNRAVRSFGATTLVIAHRPETIACTDRVICLTPTLN